MWKRLKHYFFLEETAQESVVYYNTCWAVISSWSWYLCINDLWLPIYHRFNILEYRYSL